MRERWKGVPGQPRPNAADRTDASSIGKFLTRLPQCNGARRALRNLPIEAGISSVGALDVAWPGTPFNVLCTACAISAGSALMSGAC